MLFKRSEGLTPSERFLAELCDRSFLKLWTYPNLFKKPSKELTDLLVVFGKDVLVFSDKSCAFPDTGDSMLDWSRWFRRSVARSAHQVDQAERWLRAYPDQVFLDARCAQPLPIRLPPPGEMRVHRICVALGVLERARAETGARALRINPRIVDDAEPFTVGTLSHARGWVHVFDEDSIKVVLTELSTTSDLIHYLNSKVALFEGGKFVYAESELDILAYYLWNGRKFPQHENEYRLEPNLWAKAQASPEFRAGREQNKIGEFWDGLIEYVTGHYLAQTLEYGNEMQMSDHERLVRAMAGETRFSRRILSKLILERAESARNSAVSTLLPSDQADVNYVLFIGRGDQGRDDAAYRADRMLHLRSRCIAAKAVIPEKRFIIGIALDARGVRGSSEDFIFWDTADWTEEAILSAQKLREELGYFQPGQVIESQMIEDEYPAVRTAKDLAALADALSSLTVAESTQLAEMLRDRWALA